MSPSLPYPSTQTPQGADHPWTLRREEAGPWSIDRAMGVRGRHHTLISISNQHIVCNRLQEGGTGVDF